MTTVAPAAPTATPDLGAIKGRQQATWSSGDYAVVGATLQIVGESLCEALDLRAGQKVLDVAAGNGNVTLAAARRWCDVTSTDYVPALLARGRKRAEAEGWNIEFMEADAEALPFKDNSFDAVVSSYGVMFTPNQDKAAAELLRVCKSGGKIGLANWTPEGFIGQIFKTIGKYLPPPAGVKSPALWGTRARIDELSRRRPRPSRFPRATSCSAIGRPNTGSTFFKAYYGPMLKAFAALEPAGQAALHDDIVKLIEQSNRAKDGTMVVPGEYLEIVIVKR